MTLNGDLLTPISADRPAGSYLRYEALYDQIKEARREDADLPQGDWQTTRKAADWPLVIRLATDALTKKTKDLQIAAWLTEAWLSRNGVAGLRAGLDLLHELLQQYWDTVYPEVEDGDTEMRAAPLSWIGLKLDLPVKRALLNQDGHSLVDYREARTVPTQQEADNDSDKKTERDRAIADGKLTQEEFERGFTATPKSWYVQLVEDIDGSLQTLTALDVFCAERFDLDSRPSFGPTRAALQEVRQLAAQLLARKRELEPDPVTDADADSAPPAEQPAVGGAAEPTPSARVVHVAGGPRNADEATAWIMAAARKLREERPTEPAAYLMLRGYRWGELRAHGGRIEPRELVAPPTEVRTRLKGLLLDASWPALLNAAEDVLAQPYGRGWLDLQRYALTAIDGQGGDYANVGHAVRGALRTLLADLPDLAAQTMMDDAPTANAETLAWLRAENMLPASGEAVELAVEPRPVTMRYDAYDVAKSRVRNGDARGAMELLMREAEQEKSTRARFLRRTQAAEVMIGAGMEPVAMPILQELLTQIESYRLEEWEAGDTVAHALALAYRCEKRLESGNVDWRALYQRICRLDPVRAIQLQADSNEGS